MSQYQSLVLCPQHTSVVGRSRSINVPRNRSPLIQCCDHDHEYLKHQEMMLRNIRIPSSYYTPVDPRHCSVTRDQSRQVVSLVTRSVSSVSIKRAGHVRLNRHNSFNNNNNNNIDMKNKISSSLSWEYKLAGIGLCCKGRRYDRVWHDDITLQLR